MFGAVACALLVSAFPRYAVADVRGVSASTAKGDGVYGRFDGDVDLGAGVGVRAAGPGVGPDVRLSAHFLSTVGLSADLTWPVAGSKDWSLTAALDVRPLFLPRWALDLEQGPAFWDLLLDSVSVSAGPVLTPLQAGRLGLSLEAGFGVPLSSHSQGAWLHVRGASRWIDDRTHLGGLLVLSWHTSWLSPVVD